MLQAFACDQWSTEPYRRESQQCLGFAQASDVYAFGVLLYEMYCGQHPWAGLHMAQIVYAVTIERQLLQMPEEAPESFRTLASKCMSRQQGERPDLSQVVSLLEGQVAELDA